MKLVIAVITVAIACTLFGCGSNPVRESATFPAIGSVATRGVGESLIRLDTGVLVPDINIQDDTMIGEHQLRKGRYDYYGENSKGVWFTGPEAYFHMRRVDGQICIDAIKVCAPVNYALETKLSSLYPDSFQQTLLYNGKIGNRITLAYREFSNNQARLAFSNEVDYDLSESVIIGYKGARLEVISATNTEITYRILSGFSN